MPFIKIDISGEERNSSSIYKVSKKVAKELLETLSGRNLGRVRINAYKVKMEELSSLQEWIDTELNDDELARKL